MTDAKLRKKIKEMVQDADLDTLTVKKIRKQLAEEFPKVDLKSKKDWIKTQVDKVLAQISPDDGDDSDEPAKVTKKKSKKSPAKRKRDEDYKDGKKESPKKRKQAPNTGFSKPLPLGDKLAKFVGAKEMSRAAVVKFMWAYFKENKLQDPEDGRKIKSDAKLKDLLGVDEFTGFGIQKLLAPYFPPKKVVEKKSGKAVVKVTKELLAVVGRDLLPRPKVFGLIWAYIKEHELSKDGLITCDKKLKAALGVDSFKPKELMGLFGKACTATRITTEEWEAKVAKYDDLKK